MSTQNMVFLIKSSSLEKLGTALGFWRPSVVASQLIKTFYCLKLMSEVSSLVITPTIVQGIWWEGIPSRDKHGFHSKSWKWNEGFLFAAKCASFLCECAFPLSFWCLTPGTAVVITGHAKLSRYFDFYTLSPRKDVVFLWSRHWPALLFME